MLRHNKFEDVGANWFAEAMNENVTLETLDISWNMFTTKGCVMIAEALRVILRHTGHKLEYVHNKGMCDDCRSYQGNFKTHWTLFQI